MAPSDGGGALCSTPRQGSRRKGLLFGLPRRRSPKGLAARLRRLAEARFCSTLSPRIAPDGIPVQSQASRASPRIAPIGGPAAPPPPRPTSAPAVRRLRLADVPVPAAAATADVATQYEQNPLHDTEALLMEEAAAATKAHGPRRGLGLVWRRLLRSLRLWADMATITEWALQGGRSRLLWIERLRHRPHHGDCDGRRDVPGSNRRGVLALDWRATRGSRRNLDGGPRPTRC